MRQRAKNKALQLFRHGHDRWPLRTRENLCDVLLEAGWLLVAILVPLAVNLWARQPFDFPKVAILRSLVWLMLGVWLVDGLLRRRLLWREMEGNWLLGPALGLATAYALATIGQGP